MKKKKMSFIICVVSVLLLLFSAVLNTMAHRRMLAESYVHAANLNTVGMVRRLDYAIGFGKPIEKFYGLELLMQNVMNLSEDILAVEIRDRQGKTAAGVGDAGRQVEQVSEGEEYRIQEDGVYSFTDFDAGQIVLRLDKEKMEKQMSAYISWLAKIILSITATILLVLVLYTLSGGREQADLHRVKVMSLVLLVGGQLVLGTFATVYDAVSYQDSVGHIAESAMHVVESDINEVLDKGMRFSELKGVDEYLENLCGDIEELSRMEMTGEGEAGGGETYLISLRDEQTAQLRVRAETNEELVRKKMVNHIVDTLIIIMVTIFVSLEMIGFVTSHLKQRSARKRGEMYFPGFRLFVFVSGIAFSLDSGFASILSRQLFDQMALPDSMSFLSGMPGTMQSLSIVMGLFGCGFFISRLGTKKTLLLGVSMGVAGYILCAAAVNLPMFIAARFVFGFCDGLVINTIRLYAASQVDAERHNKILVTYFAAINLGVCCSVVIGGLVADVSAYTAVFILGAVLGAVCLFLIGFSGFSDEKGGSRMLFTGALRELKYRRVWVFMLFLVVPIYIAPLFVEYTFPLFGDEIGFSNSLVSGCLMLNFLIIAYLTDPVSEWVNRHISARKAIVCYVFLQAAGIGQFVLFASAWSAVLALVLTSIWDCFGMVVIDSVLDDVKGTTAEKNTLLQMIFGKVGMVAGPVLVTAGLGRGAAGATGTIVVILLAGAGLYLAFNAMTGSV